MTDALSGERMVIHEQGKFLTVDATQRKQVETILEENGCIGSWSPNGDAIRPYNNYDCDFGEVASWSVFLGDDTDVAKIQLALDEAK